MRIAPASVDQKHILPGYDVVFIGYRKFLDGEMGELEKKNSIKNIGDWMVGLEGISLKNMSFNQVASLIVEETKLNPVGVTLTFLSCKTNGTAPCGFTSSSSCGGMDKDPKKSFDMKDSNTAFTSSIAIDDIESPVEVSYNFLPKLVDFESVNRGATHCHQLYFEEHSEEDIESSEEAVAPTMVKCANRMSHGKRKEKHGKSFSVQQLDFASENERPVLDELDIFKPSVEVSQTVVLGSAVSLGLFLDTQDKIIMASPAVNQRHLKVTHVIDNMIPGALGVGLAFDAEICVVPYQLTKEKGPDVVPIMGSHILPGTTGLSVVEDIYAKSPTVGGVVRLLRLLEMEDIVLKYYGREAAEDNEESIYNVEVFKDLLGHAKFSSMKYDCTDLFVDIPSLSMSSEHLSRYKNSGFYDKLYRKQRNFFLKNHDIRFATINGQHRGCAILLTLAGYILDPVTHLIKPSAYAKYDISENSNILSNPSIRIILPKSNILNNETLKGLREDSRNIYNRAEKDLKLGWKEEMFSLLENGSRVALANRFWSSDMLQSAEVSFIVVLKYIFI
jgi:hypothetical protein